MIVLFASFSLYPSKAFELLASFYQIWWNDRGNKILSSCKYENSDWREEKDAISEEKANKLILLDLRESTRESGMEERSSNNNLSFVVLQLNKATCLHFCS